MSLFERFLQLARADAHGVLDSLEDRELALRQCLREAELEVTNKRLRLRELEESLRTIEHARHETADRLAVLDEDVRLAIERGEDELARYAVRRLLAARSEEASRIAHARDLEAERERLTERLETQERELETLRAKVASALEAERRARRSGTPQPNDENAGTAIRDEEVELELLRRRNAEADGAPEIRS